MEKFNISKVLKDMYMSSRDELNEIMAKGTLEMCILNGRFNIVKFSKLDDKKSIKMVINIFDIWQLFKMGISPSFCCRYYKKIGTSVSTYIPLSITGYNLSLEETDELLLQCDNLQCGSRIVIKGFYWNQPRMLMGAWTTNNAKMEKAGETSVLYKSANVDKTISNKFYSGRFVCGTKKIQVFERMTKATLDHIRRESLLPLPYESLEEMFPLAKGIEHLGNRGGAVFDKIKCQTVTRMY